MTKREPTTVMIDGVEVRPEAPPEMTGPMTSEVVDSDERYEPRSLLGRGGMGEVWLYLSKRGSLSEIVVLALIGYSCIAMFSCWLGPFVLIPASATSVTLLFATQVTSKERFITVFLGTTCTALVFLVELTGWLPPAFSFVDGDLVLHARAVKLPVVGTWLALAWTTISYTAIPAIYFGRIKDKLTRAERRLFLHAWQLERMAGTETEDGAAEGT